MTTPAASPGSGTPHLRPVPDPNRAAQLVPAPDWSAVLAQPEGPHYRLAPLCAWALTETGAVVGLTVAPTGRVEPAERLAGFLGYLHASEAAREAVMQGWADAGRALVGAPAPSPLPPEPPKTAAAPAPPPAEETVTATSRITSPAPVVGEWMDGSPLYEVNGVRAYVLDPGAEPVRYVAVDRCDTHPRARFYSRQRDDGTFAPFAHRTEAGVCYLH